MESSAITEPSPPPPFSQLVPLIYVPLSGPELLSYQFSVTEHVRLLDPAQAQMEAA